LKGIKRKFYEKLDSPYSDCIKNQTDPNSFDSDLFKKTIQMQGIYNKRYCDKLCVTYSNRNFKIILKYLNDSSEFKLYRFKSI